MASLQSMCSETSLSGSASLAGVSPSYVSYRSFHAFLFIFKFKGFGVFIVCLVLVAVLPFVPPRQAWAPLVPKLVLNLWQSFCVSPSVFSLLPPHSVLHLVLDLFCPCHFHWNIQEKAWQIHFLFSSSTSCLLFLPLTASYCLPMNCPLVWPWTSRDFTYWLFY